MTGQQAWLYQTDYFKHKNEFINAVVNQRFDEANQILTKNPNFFIEINGKMTAGQDAADAFTTALANLPGDPLGLSQDVDRKFAHAGPQNPTVSVTVSANVPPMEQVNCPHGPAVSATGTGTTVVLNYDDGTLEVRQGGSHSWRNNNPGNIRPGFLDGEIGKAGGFTIFSRGQAAIMAAQPPNTLELQRQTLKTRGYDAKL